jgi:hypothetical protein
MRAAEFLDCEGLALDRVIVIVIAGTFAITMTADRAVPPAALHPTLRFNMALRQRLLLLLLLLVSIGGHDSSP